jgi:hypothetical protein
LHPSAVIQNRIISELVQQEYEVYIVKDHLILRRILKKYPDSVVFADLDENMPEKEWEAWIRHVMGDAVTKEVSIGVISATDDDNLRRKYLGAIKVRCGYTVIRSDLDKSISQILENLHSVDAKGRRKYLRATTSNESNTTINLPYNGLFINGQIKDISVVGISCTFENDPDFVKNTLFKDVQVKLQSNLLKVEGIVFGSRMDGNEKIYVILFTQRIDPDVRTRIRKYIQQNLQAKMDLELK